MTAALLQPLRVHAPPRLHAHREEIVFHNISPERVRIEITVRNQGGRRSEPTAAVIQVAPLGAFGSWQPLTALRVPALDPREPVVLEWETDQSAPRLLGKPDRVTPRQLLTALDSNDDRRGRDPAGLPSDLLKMLGQGGVHWAGNLNVFVGSQSVERHLAQALRVYPGRVNMAMFVVGSGRDAYAFRLAGNAVGWDPVLYDAMGGASLVPDFDHADTIAPGEWIEVNGRHFMMLALRPPVDCLQGTVEVHVTQRSTREVAVVEFSMDAAAAGPGCYVV